MYYSHFLLAERVGDMKGDAKVRTIVKTLRLLLNDWEKYYQTEIDKINGTGDNNAADNALSLIDNVIRSIQSLIKLLDQKKSLSEAELKWLVYVEAGLQITQEGLFKFPDPFSVPTASVASNSAASAASIDEPQRKKLSLVPYLLPTTQEAWRRRGMLALLAFFLVPMVAYLTASLLILLFTPGTNWKDPFHYYFSVVRGITAFLGVTETGFEWMSTFVKEVEMDFTAKVPIPSFYGLLLSPLLAAFTALYFTEKKIEILDPRIQALSREIWVARERLLAHAQKGKTNSAVIAGIFYCLDKGAAAWTHEKQKEDFDRANAALTLVRMGSGVAEENRLEAEKFLASVAALGERSQKGWLGCLPRRTTSSNNYTDRNAVGSELASLL